MKTLHTIRLWPRFALYLKHVRWYTRYMNFDFDRHGRPTLSYKGTLFTGFLAIGDDLAAYQLFKQFLPHNLPSSHYRLLRDFITRYVYPHMMPTHSPTSFLPSYFLLLFSYFRRSNSDTMIGRCIVLICLLHKFLRKTEG